MTKDEYIAACRALGLPPCGKRTAELLGYTKPRQLYEIVAGRAGVPGAVALLLEQYLKNGLPKAEKPWFLGEKLDPFK